MTQKTVTKHQRSEITAVPDTNILRNDLAGAFLILILFLLVVRIIFVPEILKLYNAAIVSQNISMWIAFLGSTLLAGLLMTFPVFLIVQGIAYYRDARALDRIGILAKGSISEKWVDASDGNPIYQVRYNYSCLNALQIVSKDVFQQLICDQSIDVLYLQHAPHVSRLELSSLQELINSAP